jgi:hypothetical protein
LKPNGEKGKVLSLRMGFEGLGRLMMTSTARAGFVRKASTTAPYARLLGMLLDNDKKYGTHEPIYIQQQFRESEVMRTATAGNRSRVIRGPKVGQRPSLAAPLYHSSLA